MYSSRSTLNSFFSLEPSAAGGRRKTGSTPNDAVDGSEVRHCKGAIPSNLPGHFCFWLRTWCSSMPPTTLLVLAT
jgi:hypothetical protein